MQYKFLWACLIWGCVILSTSAQRDPFVAGPSSKDQMVYQSGRVTLHFVQVDIHEALQQFAEAVHLNVSINDNVNGTVSLHLTDVPWEDALDALLQASQLDYRNINDIIYIAPSTLLAQNEEVLLQSKKQQYALQALKTDYIRIHYAKAQLLAEILKAKESSLLSERGQVGVDARTNTLILQDVPEYLPQIYRLIAELDIPVEQVMIEARIVNAKNSFTQDLGLNFQVNGHTSYGVSFDNTTAFTKWLNYDLPVAQTGSLGLAIAQLSGNILLDLEISAAESENNTKVIASPRLLTANQSEAVIRQGKQIAVEESTSSGATSVSFRDAVLELRVVPHITPDERILLQLNVKQDVLGHITHGGQPTIDTKSITTQVLVNNGATVVLGGIYSRTESDSIKRTPFLYQLPFIGHLFQDKNQLSDRDELLIFVTPTIVNDQMHNQ